MLYIGKWENPKHFFWRNGNPFRTNWCIPTICHRDSVARLKLPIITRRTAVRETIASLGIMGSKLRNPMKAIEHHSTIVSRDLRGALIMPRDTSFWNSFSIVSCLTVRHMQCTTVWHRQHMHYFLYQKYDMHVWNNHRNPSKLIHYQELGLANRPLSKYCWKSVNLSGLQYFLGRIILSVLFVLLLYEAKTYITTGGIYGISLAARELPKVLLVTFMELPKQKLL